jgi:hypothetical protein
MRQQVTSVRVIFTESKVSSSTWPTVLEHDAPHSAGFFLRDKRKSLAVVGHG